ncbi:Gfo/Idh/MocA family protein [Paenibacillus flagellatus]|uniref:Oxidoreductase n=1 Tax=Paenibacillus flagellatus TaxID=2211139 RepID=A0A2V5KCW3_9BACL|nr:Gfo/Idh/MocA family oxidoreductase [Paenibacillus flagellatus]PYI57489.1 oxidoreductase [Paenibacillus flagellatus]
MDHKLRVGMIGTGMISDTHLRAYANNPHAELYAVCDLNERRARDKAEKYRIPHVYTDYRDMLADPALDAVSICTWNCFHAEMSIAAMDAGKHALVIKPLCMTVDEALAIERAAKRSGKTLQVGYVRRFGTNAIVAKRFVDGGELGEIYYAKASCIRRLGNPGGWFADREKSGGGPLIDLGVHVIDLCWYLMGKPKVKSVSGNTYVKLGNRSHVRNFQSYRSSDYDPGRNTVEDMANAIVRFENGASLVVDVSFSLHAKQEELTVKLYGEKGGLELEPELSLVTERYDTILNATPQISSLTFDPNNGFQNEIDHFVDACLGRTETISPVEDGVEMMKILCGIYESSASKAEIHYPT